MRQRPERPRALEIAIVLALLILLVLALNACTITRGPCTVVKEVKTLYACQDGGRVFQVEPLVYP